VLPSTSERCWNLWDNRRLILERGRDSNDRERLSGLPLRSIHRAVVTYYSSSIAVFLRMSRILSVTFFGR
jgi:hypothetical protein